MKIKEYLKNKVAIYLYHITRNIGHNPKILSIEESLMLIKRNKYSVSRFGDGELKWILGLNQNSFQNNSKLLSIRLKAILKSNLTNHVVCLPETFGALDEYTEDAQKWWMIFMGKFRLIWLHYLQKEKIYFNTQISRPYLIYKNKAKCNKRFELLKELWKDRDVVIIEGDKTRFGVNNDLLDSAKSVRRILAPSINAFDNYETIFNYILNLELDRNVLILVALGPTATIMSYDLCKEGYQTIDIGHADIEYEWYLHGSKSVTLIPGKFVNEAKEKFKEDKLERYNRGYLREIIHVFK